MTYNYDPCSCGCDEKYQSLFALLDDELSPGECDALREHIKECPECYSRLTAEQKVRALVRKCCQDEAPPTLVERISLSIRIERK